MSIVPVVGISRNIFYEKPKAKKVPKLFVIPYSLHLCTMESVRQLNSVRTEKCTFSYRSKYVVKPHVLRSKKHAVLQRILNDMKMCIFLVLTEFSCLAYSKVLN